METYCQTAADLESDLSEIDVISDKFAEQSEDATGHCILALNHLDEPVKKKTGFPNRKSEILFSKRSTP